MHTRARFTSSAPCPATASVADARPAPGTPLAAGTRSHREHRRQQTTDAAASCSGARTAGSVDRVDAQGRSCAAPRRAVLASVAACWLPPGTAPVWARATDAGAAAPAPAAADAGQDFYASWPYAGPQDILPYIQANAPQGDAQAVLDAMDAFAAHYPMYRIGPEKGALLEQLLQQHRPSTAVELGSFLGYSALRIARRLPAHGLVVCLEADPACAAVVREVADFAGLGARVVVVAGLAADTLPAAAMLLARRSAGAGGSDGGAAARSAAAGGRVPAGLVLLDHCKACYLPDLQAAEALGLVGVGTVVVADNVVYPGAPGFLEHVQGSAAYSTRLLPAAYEYDQPWNPSWEPKQDAMSVSVCVAAPPTYPAA